MNETPDRKKRPTSPLTPKRAKIVGIISAVAVAATPGVYSAWQNAKAAYQQRVERTARDTQEIDLIKTVKSLELAIVALQKSSVTHQELIDIILKIRNSSDQRFSRAPASTGNRESELDRKIETLEKKIEESSKAQRKADVAFDTKPKLKSPTELREIVQQQAALAE